MTRINHMTRAAISIATFTALMLFGTMTGFFHAFSVTVMPGLDRTTPWVAVEAMQNINIAVRNPVFFVTFFVTPIIAIIAAILALRTKNKAAAVWLALAAITYLATTLAPTAAINVPMNNVLALTEPALATPQQWAEYTTDWTLWNHIRTATCLIATGFAAIGWRKL
ncbi:MAG: DUF1772 domain-containing protein [Pikeienuella sp.]